jgi:hypothetical protein
VYDERDEEARLESGVYLHDIPSTKLVRADSVGYVAAANPQRHRRERHEENVFDLSGL